MTTPKRPTYHTPTSLAIALGVAQATVSGSARYREEADAYMLRVRNGEKIATPLYLPATVARLVAEREPVNPGADD